MDWNAVSAVASSLSALIAACAIYASVVVSRKIHNEQLKSDRRLHEDQLQYNRRQALLPFWKEMLELSRIDPTKPADEPFRMSLNLLLLVTQFVKLKIVEEQVLREIFATAYKQVFTDIGATNEPVTVNGVTKPGRDFLIDNPDLKWLYDRW